VYVQYACVCIKKLFWRTHLFDLRPFLLVVCVYDPHIVEMYFPSNNELAKFKASTTRFFFFVESNHESKSTWHVLAYISAVYAEERKL
jgi:hypothetical protein